MRRRWIFRLLSVWAPWPQPAPSTRAKPFEKFDAVYTSAPVVGRSSEHAMRYSAGRCTKTRPEPACALAHTAIWQLLRRLDPSGCRSGCSTLAGRCTWRTARAHRQSPMPPSRDT
eukprot:1706131-Prymnesium_polylepis.1